MEAGSPIKEFMKGLLKEVDESLSEQGFASCPVQESHMDVELQAIAVDEEGGKAGVKILNFVEAGAGKKISNSNSHKVTIHVKKMTEKEREKEKADIEIAKSQQNFSREIALKGT